MPGGLELYALEDNFPETLSLSPGSIQQNASASRNLFVGVAVCLKRSGMDNYSS